MSETQLSFCYTVEGMSEVLGSLYSKRIRLGFQPGGASTQLKERDLKTCNSTRRRTMALLGPFDK
jgi:hypothetical protein